MATSPVTLDPASPLGSGAGGTDSERKPGPMPAPAPAGQGGPSFATAPPSSWSHRHRHRGRGRGGEGGSRSQSKSKKIVQLRLMAAFFVVVAMVTTMAGIYYWSKVDTLNGEVLFLSTDLGHAQKELDKARELLRQQDSEISAMLTRRIPGVGEITFDTLFNLNNKYLRSVNFSQSGVGEDKAIEFHAVLENKGKDPLLPNVKIILFDRMGIQTGMVKIDKEHSHGTATLAELRAEETRTYSGPLPVERDAEPKYFLVQVR